MTEKLELHGLRKTYGSHHAVEHFDLTVRDGTFLSLLGPSGSGKTTVLNMIAGLTQPSAGKILIAGEDVTDRPANLRNIGIVFQNYALFPHQTVFGNVAFPLEVRRLSPQETARRVKDVLAMVGLDHLVDRFPSELSGGQQQRVALARAIVFEPALLLLDEPLGALDRRLRESLRRELRKLQRQTGITTIMVTHDQEEALSMSDQIVVMSNGRAEQCATPEELYRRPHNRFVAEFMGSANVVTGEWVDLSAVGRPSSGGAEAAFAIRPENVAFHAVRPGAAALASTVVTSEYCGDYYRLHLMVDAIGPMTSHMRITEPPAAGMRGFVSWRPVDMHPLRGHENAGTCRQT